jgi:hypothetical protein
MSPSSLNEASVNFYFLPLTVVSCWGKRVPAEQGLINEYHSPTSSSGSVYIGLGLFKLGLGLISGSLWHWFLFQDLFLLYATCLEGITNHLLRQLRLRVPSLQYGNSLSLNFPAPLLNHHFGAEISRARSYSSVTISFTLRSYPLSLGCHGVHDIVDCT